MMTSTPGWPRTAPALLLSFLALVGCAEELELYKAPAGQVYPLFDPASSPARVPTPTDLVRDPVSKRLALPVPACALLESGPFVRTKAGTSAAAAPAVKVAASATVLTLDKDALAYARFSAEAAGAHVIYLSADLKLEVLDATGKAVASSRSEKGIAACAEVGARHLVELSAKGGYTLRITPAKTVASVGVVVAPDTAQLAFNRYLGTLDGYPASAVAEVTFSGLVDATTLTQQSVRVYDITVASRPRRVTSLVLDAAAVAGQGGRQRTRLRIWNPAGWKRGGRFAGYIIGGKGGVAAARKADGSAGAPAIRAPLFELAVGARPLCVWDNNRSWDAATASCVTPASGALAATGCCTHNHASLITSSVKATMEARADIKALSLVKRQEAIKAEVLATATRFERLRQGFVGLLKVPSAAGVAPGDVVSLWSFTVSSMNEAVFSPTGPAPKIPLPSDLLLNPITGLLKVPLAASASAAEKEWTAYLNGLDGWLTSTPASLDFLDGLDASSLSPGKSLLLLEVSAAGSPVIDTTASAVWDSSKKRLTLTRKGGWKRGTRYAVAALGGSSGLKNGASVTAPGLRRAALMDLALSPHPLCTWDKTRAIDASGSCSPASGSNATGCCTTLLISSFMDDPAGTTGRLTALARATTLEKVRQQYDALIRPLVTAGLVTRQDLLALWSFTTASMPEVIYDPTAGAIPMPNDLLLHSKTGKVNIPAPASETAGAKALRLGLNSLDGFSTLGAILAAHTGSLDRTSMVMDTSIKLVDLSTGTSATSLITADIDNTAGAIVVTPAAPLAENRRYGLALISKASTGSKYSAGGLWDKNGRRVTAAPFMALARSTATLYSAGKSTISGLDDATAKAAEQARLALKPLFAVLDKGGVSRQDVAAAWTFTTQTVTEPLTRLRALPWTVLGPVDALKPSFDGDLAPASTIPGAGAALAVDAIGAWVANGKFTSLNVLDEAGSGALLADPAKAKVSTVPFILTLPKTTAPAAGYPVVIFQHGLGRHRVDALALANSLAQKGMASIAFDTIYHGARSWCTMDAHCTAGVCIKATGQCATGKLKTDTVGLPLASGERFLNTANPFATRDNMRQHVVDAAALLRAISLGAAAGIKTSGGAAGGVKFDPNKVHYVGQSMGAILGALVLATDSLPHRGVLNVPGAPLSDIIFTAPAFKNTKDAVLKARGITAGSLAELKLRATFQWILDPADPGNFARYLELSGLPDRLSTGGGLVPKKEVMVQLAGKDTTVPTALGQRLAGLIGVSASELARTTYATQGHSFLLSPSPVGTAAATAAAQAQVATFLSTGAVCQPVTSTGKCQ